MHRKAKLNIDYKILHTSEIKVIKNNMTDKLIQEELDLVLDIEEHIEDHNPHELETPLGISMSSKPGTRCCVAKKMHAMPR